MAKCFLLLFQIIWDAVAHNTSCLCYAIDRHALHTSSGGTQYHPSRLHHRPLQYSQFACVRQNLCPLQQPDSAPKQLYMSAALTGFATLAIIIPPNVPSKITKRTIAIIVFFFISTPSLFYVFRMCLKS